MGFVLCRRNHRISMVRRYVRLNKSTPAPLDEKDGDSEGGLHTQIKAIVKAVWEVCCFPCAKCMLQCMSYNGDMKNYT